MTVTREELMMIRMYLLQQMDKYIFENISEENAEYWYENGLEDGWDDKTLREYAESEETWNDCVTAFVECCKLEGFVK